MHAKSLKLSDIYHTNKLHRSKSRLQVNGNHWELKHQNKKKMKKLNTRLWVLLKAYIIIYVTLLILRRWYLKNWKTRYSFKILLRQTIRVIKPVLIPFKVKGMRMSLKKGIRYINYWSRMKIQKWMTKLQKPLNRTTRIWTTSLC